MAKGVGDGLGDTKFEDLHVFDDDGLDAGVQQVIREPNDGGCEALGDQSLCPIAIQTLEGS